MLQRLLTDIISVFNILFFSFSEFLKIVLEGALLLISALKEINLVQALTLNILIDIL